MVESFEEIVATSYSIRQVILRMGFVPAGGNYMTIKALILKKGLDTSHFRGQGWLKDQKRPYEKPGTKQLSELLVKGQHYSSYRLKNRLLASGLKEPVCEHCGHKDWLEMPIPLELHHVDGDKNNNELENLMLLCPNCHAMTSNYRGKGKKK